MSLIYGFVKLQELIKDRRGHGPDWAIGPPYPKVSTGGIVVRRTHRLC
jgi:hypothetical protein